MNTCDQILRIFEISSRIAERVRTDEYAWQWSACSGLIGLEERQQTVCVERNYTHVEQSAISRSYILTLIVYESRRPQESSAFHLATDARIQSFIDECVPERKKRTDRSWLVSKMQTKTRAKSNETEKIRTFSIEICRRSEGRTKQPKSHGSLFLSSVFVWSFQFVWLATCSVFLGTPREPTLGAFRGSLESFHVAQLQITSTC